MANVTVDVTVGQTIFAAFTVFGGSVSSSNCPNGRLSNIRVRLPGSLSITRYGFDFDCQDPETEGGCEFTTGDQVNIFAVTLLFITIYRARWSFRGRGTDGCSGSRWVLAFSLGLGITLLDFIIQ